MVRGRRSINTLMDSVECLMDDYPAKADSMMQRIDIQSVKNKEQRARYALLYTATQYKNYQPFTSDSLILQAVNYYSNSINYDYRFLSFYYLGCVYLEMKQYTEASVAMSQAELLIDKIDNDYWKGLLYARLGNIFLEVCDYNRSEYYYKKAEISFGNAEKEQHRLYAIYYLGITKINKMEYTAADSILRLAEKSSLTIGDSIIYDFCLFNRLLNYLYLKEIDSATCLIDNYGLDRGESSDSFSYLTKMSLYFCSVNDYSRSELLLKQAQKCNLSVSDSIDFYYLSYKLAKKKGLFEESIECLQKCISIQNSYIRKILMEPIIGAQYNVYRAETEIESAKARNKITVLTASVIVFLLLIVCITIYSRSKRIEADSKIRDYICTINELTTQISVNQDKISSLNVKVREMLRQQFDPSDFLYTRFYEQIDDSKKAERLYRVVKSQLDGFTNAKNIGRIDEMLDEAFDGIMTKLALSGLELKEKDLLLIRFVLSGFSAKSIAALLNDTHQNIGQRKKRLLDKIQIFAPELMDELRIALNNR